MPTDRQTVLIRPDGTIVVPDLAEPLAGLAPRAPLPWTLPRAPRADLAARAAAARDLLGPTCRLCGWRCAVDRRRGARGRCGLGAEVVWAPPRLLWGEEALLGRPGLALRPRGCGLRCSFCYADDLLPPGGDAAPSDPAAWPGAVHLHILGGNPDESLPGILDALAAWEDPRPVVWNTHAYVTPEAARLLVGVADVVLADLKFGPGDCARRIAGPPDYWAVATAALRCWADLGLPLLVRHVALPGHLDCCSAPVVDWLQAEVPQAHVELLAQFEPWSGGRDGLDRRLSDDELARLAGWRGKFDEHS